MSDREPKAQRSHGSAGLDDEAQVLMRQVYDRLGKEKGGRALFFVAGTAAKDGGTDEETLAEIKRLLRHVLAGGTIPDRRFRSAVVWLPRILALALASGSAYLFALERLTGPLHGPGVLIEITGATLALLTWGASTLIVRRYRKK